MSVKILCDTTCDLSNEQANEMGITLLPLKVFFTDGEQHIDGTLLSKLDFFKKMRESPRLPMTSQINPEEFAEAFTQALEDCDEVVLLTISSGLSGTYNAAVLARESMPEKERIFVIDTWQVSITLALLSREACGMAKQGLSGAEIVAALEDMRPRTKFAAVIGTFDNLKKGGRLPPAVAWVGNVLGIKPVVTLREGKAALIDKVRGSRQKVISWLIDHAEKEGADLVAKPVAVGYGEDSEDGKELIAALAQKNVDTLHLLVLQIGSVIATHVGDKALGIGYICPKPVNSQI